MKPPLYDAGLGAAAFRSQGRPALQSRRVNAAPVDGHSSARQAIGGLSEAPPRLGTAVAPHSSTPHARPRSAAPTCVHCPASGRSVRTTRRPTRPHGHGHAPGRGTRRRSRPRRCRPSAARPRRRNQARSALCRCDVASPSAPANAPPPHCVRVARCAPRAAIAVAAHDGECGAPGAWLCADPQAGRCGRCSGPRPLAAVGGARCTAALGPAVPVGPVEPVGQGLAPPAPPCSECENADHVNNSSSSVSCCVAPNVSPV